MRLHMEDGEIYREYTVTEITNRLDISRSTVYRRLKNGEFEGYKEKGHWIIPVSEDKNKEIYEKITDREKRYISRQKNFIPKTLEIAKSMQTGISQIPFNKSLIKTAQQARLAANEHINKINNIQSVVIKDFKPALSKFYRKKNTMISQLNGIGSQLDNLIPSLQIEPMIIQQQRKTRSQFQNNIGNIAEEINRNINNFTPIITSKEINRINQLINYRTRNIMKNMVTTSAITNSVASAQLNSFKAYNQSYLTEFEYLINDIADQLKNIDLLNYSKSDFSVKDKTTIKVFQKYKFLKNLIEQILFIKAEIDRQIAQNIGLNYFLLHRFILLYILLILFLIYNPDLINVYAGAFQELFPKLLESLSPYINQENILLALTKVQSSWDEIPSFIKDMIFWLIPNPFVKNSNKSNDKPIFEPTYINGIYYDQNGIPICINCFNKNKEKIFLKNIPETSKYDYVCTECSHKYKLTKNV